MPDDGIIKIPLRDRSGTPVAYATIDAVDAHLAAHRWCLDGRGYAARTVRIGGGKQRRHRLHRVVSGLTSGDGLEVDHINGDPLDNRRANLRVVTRQQNMQNIAVTGGVSQYRGVSPRDGRWIATVQINQRQHYLGVFDLETDAAAAARAFRAEHMPFSVERSAA